jgi:hypothetical protein
MNIPDEAPKLSPWPFIVGDAVLLGTAAVVASQSVAPLTGTPLVATVVCVGLGAALACVPFLLNYTRRQDLALAERQNEIAALARITAESAEQLGIAAQGLQSLNELTQRSLKHLDQLPQKLQEKINDFKTQLNEVAVTENEMLAQEVNTLRTSEIERLETTFASVKKTAAELATLETATRQHLAEFTESLARFANTADHAKPGTPSAPDLRIAIERALTSAHADAIAAFENATAKALATIETRLGQITATAATSPTESPAPAVLPPSLSPPSFAAPKSPLTTTAESRGLSETSPASERRSETTSAVSPAPSSPVVSTATNPPPTAATAPSTPPAAAENPAAPRKRTTRKASAHDDEQPSLGLELADPSVEDEYSQPAPDDDVSAPALSSDGLTRLLVTAYIGIGNKLFVRGEGPGLSWDRGAPLQFVSIGKWRWETADATDPLTIKLYKNDAEESAMPGELTLQPGHQQEVRASF